MFKSMYECMLLLTYSTKLIIYTHSSGLLWSDWLPYVHLLGDILVAKGQTAIVIY